MGSGLSGGTGVHVLLDDGEDRMGQRFCRCADDFGEVRHSGGRFDHDVHPHGLGEGDVLSEGAGGKGGIDLLEVEIADPVGVFGDQLDRIAAVVGDVAGVEAEVDELGIGGFEEALDVGLVADMAVGVGVELGVHAVFFEHASAEFVVAVDQSGPLLGGELARLLFVPREVVAP